MEIALENEPLERSYSVRRSKIMLCVKTCLLANDRIPKGSFLFYNLSEMIVVKYTKWHFHQRGMGKRFQCCLLDNGTTPTYEETLHDKYDFRFVNMPPILSAKYGTGLKLKVKNVELRESQKIFWEGKLTSLRAFYTTADIEKDEEIFWDYIYHKKKLDHCICGKLAADCSELERKDENDWIVERVMDHCLIPNKENHYFVKWKDLDFVNNSWEVESTLVGMFFLLN